MLPTVIYKPKLTSIPYRSRVPKRKNCQGMLRGIDGASNGRMTNQQRSESSD